MYVGICIFRIQCSCRISPIPLICTFLAETAGAAPVTRIVNSSSDVSAFDGITTLREAVEASANDDIVEFSPSLAGKTIRLDQGEIVLEKSIIVRGNPLLGRPVITSAKIDPKRLFKIENGVAPTLSHLVLTGGVADRGGAIHSEGNVILMHCEFTNNRASNLGGAIYHSDLTLIMEDCTFTGNTANAGGALMEDGNSFLTARRCHFEANSATGHSDVVTSGGAVFVRGSGLELVDCDFLGNTANGGGLALAASDSSLSTSRCQFKGNAPGLDAVIAGPALSLITSAANFNNSIFSGNAGMAIDAQVHDSDLTLKNCTLSGNGHGALSVFNIGVHLQNTLIWDNGGTAIPNTSLTLFGTTSLSSEYSLMQSWDLSGSGPGNLDGTDPLNDPAFLSPINIADVPSIGGNLEPAFHSTVVEAGDNAAGVGVLDVTGATRFIGATVDIGAIEVQRRTVYVDGSSNAAPADGTTWATAYPTLSEALDNSIAHDFIKIAAGIYTADVGPGRSAGDPNENFEINYPMTLSGGYPAGGGERDLDANLSALSGNIAGDEDTRNILALFLDDDAELVLEGLHFTRADATGPPADNIGALSVSSGSARLIDCRFHHNARAITGRNAEIELRRCQFVSNRGAPQRSASFFNCEVRYVNTLISANQDNLHHEQGTVSAVNVELSGSTSGFRLLSGTQGTFTNFTGAGNRIAPIILNDGTHADIINSIIWNNGLAEGPEASVFLFAGSTINFSHSIIQFYNLLDEGPGNFDGTDPISNPAFQILIPPSWAPLAGARYSLSSGTPAMNAGDASANSEPLDLAGKPRVQGDGITLGAYEEILGFFDEDEDKLPNWWEFEHSAQNDTESLAPNSDEDGDGLDNLTEFIHGLDPNVPNVARDYMKTFVMDVAGEKYLAMRFRLSPAGKVDFWTHMQRSHDLTPESWSAFEAFREPDVEGQFEAVYRSTIPFGSRPKEFLRIKSVPLEIFIR